MKIKKSHLKELIKQTISEISKRKQFQIPIIDKLKVNKIVKKLKLKIGVHYDIGVGKGSTFILELSPKFNEKDLDRIIDLFIRNRIQVKEL